MKKYVLLIILFVRIWCSIYCQEQYGINYSPVEYPLTPEASSLFKYSDISLTDNTGVTNISVPIYTIEAYGGLKIPIKLNYATVGVKVNQNATRVGLGWDLIAGGEISHIVQDLPDHPDGFSLHKIIDLETFHPSSDLCSRVGSDCALAEDIVGGFPRSHSKRDTQPDYYAYNFLEYSGKFFKNSTTNEIISIPQNRFKVSDNFKSITDSKGLIYEFEGKVYTNNSFCEPSSVSDIVGLDHSLSAFQSTLKLNKIKLTNGEEILFKYDKILTYEYISSKNQEYREQHKNALCNTNIPSGGSLTECEVTSQVFENVLTSIEYRGVKIEFRYSDEIPSNGIRTRKDIKDDVALTKIVVINELNKKIKEYRLDYSYFEVALNSIHPKTGESFAHRLKLERVLDLISKEEYHFEYYEEGGLPLRYSHNQDYMGYYKGRGNHSLIPTVVASNNIQILGKGANREPSLNGAKAFILEKVYYPTKGWTRLDYELDSYYTTKNEQKIGNWSENLISHHGEQIFFTKEKTFILPSSHNPKNTYFTFFHDIEIENTGGGPIGDGIPEGGEFCQAWLKDTTGKVLASFTSTTQVQEAPATHLTLSPGSTYQLGMQKVGNRHCKMELGYTYTYTETKTKEYSAAGIRLKQIENFDGNKVFMKTFDYTDPETNESSGIFKADPIFNKKDFTLKRNHSSKTTQCNYEIVYGKPINNLGNKDIKYKYITELFSNENKNNGKKVSQYKDIVSFANRRDYSDINFPLSPTIEWSRNKLDKEYYYGSNNILLKENLYLYEVDDVLNPGTKYSGLKFKQIPGFSFKMEGYHCADQSCWPEYSYQYKFLIYTGWLKNKGKITKEYFYTDSGALQSTLTTQTDYQYNNPAHQQVTKTTVSNSKGEVIETSYQYAHEKNNTRLINENRISIPLQTTVTKGGTTVSDQLTQYATFGNLYLPQYIFSKKGATTSSTATDRKLTYDRYDAKGNLLQYHTEDGLYTSILWGYNGQYPIAKVEGARYDEISSYANNISGLRLAVPHAMVTTYTYEPLVGVTSITDPSGQVQTFEYDAFNRLKQVKDHEGKILKNYEYHYQNQKP